VKALGALLGAVIAPIVLVVLVMTIYPRVSGENWDWVTPALTIVFAGIACIGGAIAGAMIASALQSGDLRRAKTTALVALVMVAAFPTWLANIWYGPQPKVKPRTVKQRDEWTQERLAHFDKYGFSEQPGRSLAWSIRSCLRSNSCQLEHWRSYENGEAGVGSNILAYRLEDDGWRYDILKDTSWHYFVFPDPRLKRDGPVFDVGRYDIYRRESRDAPAFATDSVLAALLNIPPCIARFAQSAAIAGVWDGRPDTLAAVMADKWSTPEGCPEVGLYARPEQPRLPWEFAAQGGDAKYVRFEISPSRDSVGVPFRFAFMFNGRGFMREPNGNWHVRPGSIPYNGDPPPPRCLFDLTVPCEEPPG
jgi:hypothetical protein